MQKIINAHCHIYPDDVAAKAVKGISDFYGVEVPFDGTSADLIREGSAFGVVRYLVQSVATTPLQVPAINNFIGSQVKAHPDLFIGFGTLHPDSSDIEGDLDGLIANGLTGVKLHPDFQQFSMAGEKAVRLGNAIEARGLPILVHCGDKRYELSNPDQMKVFLERFPGITVIGAHMGGWSRWEEARDKLGGFSNLYVDTSSSLHLMTADLACSLIDTFGCDKVLFGTDYPVFRIDREIENIRSLGLSKEEEDMIFYGNAARLFGVE